MRRSRLRGTLFLTLVVLASLIFECRAFGENIESIGASSSSPDQDLFLLEVSPMEPKAVKELIKRLNNRLADLGFSPRSYVSEAERSTDVEGLRRSVHRRLNTNTDIKSLEFLLMWPDGRKVHALLLDDDPSRSPNVAFVSTPKVWNSLDQKLQLHRFAKVEGISLAALQPALQHDHNYNQLASLARNILPKTPETEFQSLFPRFPL
ncbi:uncharacterized protein SRS1_10057 [Sporisorium reilianum f. sp. reilianum]|uniref:Uncharacterized protein n=1 Tax=Sporisorium reilianum f. sp. reilianum TaxID=72559 RepID=A0A2N8ULS4_9BASI|nr:uncharacterized protein SRS1_10057 [Sporisorium reilianum f. sp. reilianum]